MSIKQIRLSAQAREQLIRLKTRTGNFLVELGPRDLVRFGHGGRGRGSYDRRATGGSGAAGLTRL